LFLPADLYALFNLGETGTDLLPATGICSAERAIPIAVRQQINQVGRNLVFNQISNTLSAPFCLGLAVSANIPSEEPLLYIYDGSPTPVGSLQINSENITFTLNGQEAFFDRNFPIAFDRFQLCSNGTFMNLYLNCSLVASTPFSTTGVSESAVISLFTPLLQTTPRFGVSKYWIRGGWSWFSCDVCNIPMTGTISAPGRSKCGAANACRCGSWFQLECCITFQAVDI